MPSFRPVLRCLPFALAAVLSAADQAIPASTVGRKPLMRDFMGINFHTFQVEAARYSEVAGHARDYHPMPWDLEGDTSRLPPFPLSQQAIRAGKQIDWNVLYGSWKQAGFSVDASLSFEWYKDHGGFKNPAADCRQYGEAIARAFGPSGSMPVIDAFEIGNEPGEKWSDADYMTIFTNMAAGLRAGDPSATIVTCTMSALEPDGWEKSIKLLTGHEKLFDVINLHSYSMKIGWPTWERVHPESPECPRFLDTVDAMVAYRDAHAELHDKQIWLTEFGYDAASEAAMTRRQKPFEQWLPSTELQQAQWIVRCFLIFASKDLNRAYLYWFDDKDGASFHGASGLTRNGVPKPAFFATRQLYQRLGDFRFVRLVSQEPDGLWNAEFTAEDGRVAWVVWSGSSGKAPVECRLDVPRRLERVESLALSEGDPPAQPWKPDGDSAIRLAVSESPIYLFFPAP